MSAAITEVRERTPQLGIRFSFPEMPKLPSLPTFRTRDSVKPRTSVPGDDDDEPLKPPVMLERTKKTKSVKLDPDATPLAVKDEDIELTYHNDNPTPVADAAHLSDDPGPSEEATIPEDAGLAPEAEAKTIEPPQVRKEIVVKLPSMLKPRQVSPPPPPPRELGEYHLPNWDLLGDAEHGYAQSQEKFVREKAAILEQALKEFDIDAHVVEIDTGPVITMYELALAPGVKVSAISALSNDMQRALKAETVRIVAPIPGKSTVGIEVPNEQKEKVRLKELMQLAPDAMGKMMIPLFLGKDASGEPLITDLAAMPHCLIAGTTGSGKSVCINTIIMSIMYLQRPDMVKLILVDPKVVEMAPFKDIPHLMCPVINETGRATSVLDWACEKMDERYEFLAEAGVRNIKGYNSLTQEELIERFKPTTPEEEAKIPKKLPVHRDHHRRIGRLDDDLRQGSRIVHRPHRAEGPRGRHSPDPGDPAAAGDGRHGADQVEHAEQDRVPRRIEDGLAHRARSKRRGAFARPGRHALPPAGRQQAAARPGHVHRRQGNPREREARQRSGGRAVRARAGADQSQHRRRAATWRRTTSSTTPSESCSKPSAAAYRCFSAA